MDITFVKHQDTGATLTLEPTQDTLFVLPSSSSETRVDLRMQNPGVQAFILGLFETKESESFIINQDHQAPETESHVLLKTIVMPNGNFSYQGNLHIQALATGVVASQEARGLLLGEESRFKVVPALEILPSDVICKHKASAAPVNKDSLYTLQTKGFSEDESRKILERAFLKGALDVLSDWGLSEEEVTQVQNHFSKLFPQS